MQPRRVDPAAVRAAVAGRGSQEAVAGEVGISYGTLRKWLSVGSDYDPRNREQVRLLARWAGLRVDDLLTPDPWAEALARGKAAVS